MTVSADHPVSAAINHLYRVLEGTDELDSDTYLSPVADILFALPKTDVLPFIQPTVGILSRPDIENTYSIIAFLNELVRRISLNDVLKAITMDDLVRGVSSSADEVSIACLELVRRADPADSAADPNLIKAVIQRQLEESTKTSATSILRGLLTKSRAIRKLVFSRDNTELLLRLKEQAPAMLMELVEAGLPAMDTDISPIWIHYDMESEDFADVIQMIHFYGTLLANPHPQSLTRTLNDIIDKVFSLYTDTNSADRVHYLNYIYSFFRALSEQETEVFYYYEKKHSILLDHSHDLGLLASISPSYLSSYEDVLRNLTLNFESVPAFDNLIAQHSSYVLLKISGRTIMSLSIEDRLSIIEKLSRTQWGATDLLSKWPRVMDFLLESEVYEPRIRATLIRTLENFLQTFWSITENSIWKDRIRRRLNVLTGNISRPPQVLLET